MLQVLLFSAVLCQELGLSNVGNIITEPQQCSSWGQGWQSKSGCGVCWSGFQKSLYMVNQVWPSYTNFNASTGEALGVKYLEIRNYQMVCNSNPCSRLPFLGTFTNPQIKDQTREFFLIDPITKQETRVGCPLKGQFSNNDNFYVTASPNGNVLRDYIIYNEQLECKDLQCNRAMLYDFAQKRTIELGRLLNSYAPLCTTNDDGLCVILRAFPSPTGKVIAVLLHDDNFRKSIAVNGSPMDYTQNMVVYFMDANALLSGRVSILATQKLRAPKGIFANILNYKWSPKEDGFGFVGSALKTSSDERQDTAFDFFVNPTTPAEFRECQNSKLRTCECGNEATTSGNYRYPDGLFVFDLTSKSKESSFNCGNPL
jgi:hypothetical protein